MIISCVYRRLRGYAQGVVRSPDNFTASIAEPNPGRKAINKEGRDMSPHIVSIWALRMGEGGSDFTSLPVRQES